MNGWTYPGWKLPAVTSVAFLSVSVFMLRNGSFGMSTLYAFVAGGWAVVFGLAVARRLK